MTCAKDVPSDSAEEIRRELLTPEDLTDPGKTGQPMNDDPTRGVDVHGIDGAPLSR